MLAVDAAKIAKSKAQEKYQSNFDWIIRRITLEIKRTANEGRKRIEVVITNDQLEFVGQKEIIEYFQHLQYDIVALPHIENERLNKSWSLHRDFKFKHIGVKFILNW